METEDSWQYSKEPATGPYSEPDESIPRPRTPFFKTFLTFHLRLGLPSGVFLSVFKTKILMSNKNKFLYHRDMHIKRTFVESHSVWNHL
jgi:hypothetical protein